MRAERILQGYTQRCGTAHCVPMTVVGLDRMHLEFARLHYPTAACGVQNLACVTLMIPRERAMYQTHIATDMLGLPPKFEPVRC